MLNYYRRFLPHAAATQASLHTLLAGPRTKGSQSIKWTPELNRAFEECKAFGRQHRGGCITPQAVTQSSTPEDG
jgi:hypothetical protein